MIDAESFLDVALDRGFDFYTGVPCSFLTPLINGAISHPRLHYVGATSEGEAVAMASGAWLAGRLPVVMAQNSGLGNMVNPITSLNHPFGIPFLLTCTWRGMPGLQDEPQHEMMGRIMHDLLDTMEVQHRPFPEEPGAVEPALDDVREQMTAKELPVAMVMRKGSVAGGPLEQEIPAPRRRTATVRDHTRHGGLPRRVDLLEAVLARIPEPAVVIATTGKCGRELFTLDDRPQHLYQVGSMGCASAMGLGVALNTDRPVVVLDGDGAALMKLGNIATAGASNATNLVHIVLDNQVHDSTGGQRTVSAGVDFGEIALACGYRTAARCDDVAGFTAAFGDALVRPGPHLVHARISPGSLAKLGRPTVTPHEVARRFRTFVNSPRQP